MIASNTRWMTIESLAARLEVEPEDLFEAFENDEPCLGWHIMRREIRTDEQFGEGIRYVFRGVGEAKRLVPPVSDKGPASAPKTKPVPELASVEAPDAVKDPTPWLPQRELAELLGCATKSVRGTWTKGSRVKGHYIERRAVKPGEEHGRVLFLFRGTTERPKDQKKEAQINDISITDDGWTTVENLASELGVKRATIRSAATKPHRVRDKRVERRRAKLNERLSGRMQYLYRIVEEEEVKNGRGWKTGDAIAEQLEVDVSYVHRAVREGAAIDGTHIERREAEAKERYRGRKWMYRVAAPESTDLDEQIQMSGTEWMGSKDLASSLGVAEHTIRNAYNASSLVGTLQIDRRDAKPHEKTHGRMKYVFRATEPISADENQTNVAKAPPQPHQSGITTVPHLSGQVATEATTDLSELLQQAALYSLNHPEDSPAIFRFLSAPARG